eukprot:805328-Rhodomonas_salina.1
MAFAQGALASVTWRVSRGHAALASVTCSLGECHVQPWRVSRAALARVTCSAHSERKGRALRRSESKAERG